MTITEDTRLRVEENFGVKQNITVWQMQRLIDLSHDMAEVGDGSGMANKAVMTKYYERYWEEDQFKRYLDRQGGRDLSYVVYVQDTSEAGYKTWRRVKEFDELWDAAQRAKLILEENPSVRIAFGLIEHIEYRPPRAMLDE